MTTYKKLLERIVSVSPQTVRIGIDQHARDVVVAIKLDASVPMHSQKMDSLQLVLLAQALGKSKIKVSCVHEAGPCGYALHRQLEASGVQSRIIAPQLLGRGKCRKTDKVDAQALVALLDSYERGNTRAFSVVRVPSETQEREREQSRQRQMYSRQRASWEHRGRSMMLRHGYHVTGPWWGKQRWPKLKEELPEWMLESLESMREVIEKLHTLERQISKTLEKSAPAKLPKGLGALTWVTLLREAQGWTQFSNRRQVSSYTGLCPSICQSGTSQKEGSIDRHGNRRIRVMLIEAIWRLAHWQPNYRPVRKLAEGIIRGAARKKLAVAAARKLAVDIWRLSTGRTTPGKLGLVMMPIR
jgi:transposase